MEPSPTKLALSLEGLVAGGRALVAETRDELVVANLAAVDARALMETLLGLGWQVSVEDATPDVVEPEDISETFQPYRLTVGKPAAPYGASFAVSRAGVQGWLADAARDPVLRTASLDTTVETLAGRLAPWDDPAPGEVQSTGCDPRKVVRDLTRDGRLSSSVDAWILRDPDAQLPWTHWAVRVWAQAAGAELLRALSDEVEEDGRLMFRGPPLVRLAVEPDVATALGEGGFRSLQRAAAWVFESPTEMRPRHDLFAPEIARTAPTGQAAGEVFQRAAGPALEGARIARAFGLAEQSRDSLKAMTDLRKAIGEEIGKLSDTTRQIAAAVAAALFAGIALIAARLVIESPDPIVKAASAVIGVVLFLYVAAVVGSGIQYVRLQRRLRAEWHAKIYRFIPDEDYKRMVTQPAASAELGFAIAAWIGAGAAALLLILVLVATFSDFPPHSGAREARAAVQPVEPALGPNRAAGSPPEKHTASASDKAGDLTYSQNPNRGEGRPEANLSIHVDTSGSTGKAQDAPAKSQVAAGPERGAR